MDAKSKELAALAASIAGHCQKCFKYHLNESKKLNIDKQDIDEVINLAKAIRLNGDKSTDEFAENTLNELSKQGAKHE